MATSSSRYFTTISFVLLALTISFTTSSRILLDEASPPVAPAAISPEDSDSIENPNPNVGTPLGAIFPPSTGGAGEVDGADHTLTFFMHDILGGSNPSAKAVTGIVTNPTVNGQVPFAKPNGANLPVNNGVPQDDGNNGIINNNNIPFLTGLGGTTSSVFQNNGNSNNNVFPSINGGQLPQGNALRQLMFGTLTVIDDELTEGHELGSGLIGKAQGYYVSSSIDGNSQTMAFTVMFVHGSYIDSLSFMGVHRSAVAESQLAVMGGTGKFLNAKGHATVKTFEGTNQQNNDGLETLLQFTVYLSY
ncbi:hypothetical protein L6452_37678 [Arctium lappa]|uniref:Uncharacterized protein n=1 Tax=Arctium lappa TaxID=4217 RepID=A0ACB8Y553_ARCLA|nr:hypothetical protein L6452_37678 [Arctium lappa]